MGWGSNTGRRDQSNFITAVESSRRFDIETAQRAEQVAVNQRLSRERAGAAEHAKEKAALDAASAATRDQALKSDELKGRIDTLTAVLAKSSRLSTEETVYWKTELAHLSGRLSTLRAAEAEVWERDRPAREARAKAQEAEIARQTQLNRERAESEEAERQRTARLESLRAEAQQTEIAQAERVKREREIAVKAEREKRVEIETNRLSSDCRGAMSQLSNSNQFQMELAEQAVKIDQLITAGAKGEACRSMSAIITRYGGLRENVLKCRTEAQELRLTQVSPDVFLPFASAANAIVTNFDTFSRRAGCS